MPTAETFTGWLVNYPGYVIFSLLLTFFLLGEVGRWLLNKHIAIKSLQPIIKMLIVSCVLIMTLGFFLNGAVITANGWRMPVAPESIGYYNWETNANILQSYENESPRHTLLRQSTKLKFLADIIALNVTDNITLWISFGDTLAYVSTLILLIVFILRAFIGPISIIRQ